MCTLCVVASACLICALPCVLLWVMYSHKSMFLIASALHKQAFSTLCMWVLCALKYYVAGVALPARCILFVLSLPGGVWSQFFFIHMRPWNCLCGCLEGGVRRVERKEECENGLYLFRWGPFTEFVSAASHWWASFDTVVDNPSLYVCVTSWRSVSYSAQILWDCTTWMDPCHSFFTGDTWNRHR